MDYGYESLILSILSQLAVQGEFVPVEVEVEVEVEMEVEMEREVEMEME